jgi:hypothetical protein
MTPLQTKRPRTTKPTTKRATKPRATKAVIARRIREAGERALAEAEMRRNAAEPGPEPLPELGGQKGPEPTRYGDWEKKGVISDF